MAKWRYHAAMRSKAQKLQDFAKMYGPDPSPAWAFTPTGRVTFVHSPRRLGKTLATADYSAIEQRILATMSMSRDRVRFTIDAFCDNATRDAFRKAFGVPLAAKFGPITTVTVICRPSQFARFMIYRNDFGGKNSFKELKPELFNPEPQPDLIDVSGNPAG